MEHEIIRSLKEFGLTDYEARVYYGACIADIAGATELSKISEVPRARIYDILSTLARKGWINIIDGKPTKYQAQNYKIIKEKLESEEKRLKKSKTAILEEVISYSKNYENEDSEASQELILGKKDVLSKMRKWIAASKTNILILYFSDILIEELYADLERCGKRGIKIDIILNSEQQFRKTKKSKKLFNVRRGDEKYPKHGNFIVDKKYYLNIFEKNDDINAVQIYYNKCVLCINAWLNRFWEECTKV